MPPICSIRRRRGWPSSTAACGRWNAPSGRPRFGLWGLWSLFGPQLFADLVDITFAMGRVFYEKLAAAADFVPLHEPQCNIVVFRHVPAALREPPAEVLGRFQFELRRRIVESGEFYIVSTKIDGVGAPARDDHQSLDHARAPRPAPGRPPPGREAVAPGLTADELAGTR